MKREVTSPKKIMAVVGVAVVVAVAAVGAGRAAGNRQYVEHTEQAHRGTRAPSCPRSRDPLRYQG